MDSFTKGNLMAKVNFKGKRAIYISWANGSTSPSMVLG